MAKTLNGRWRIRHCWQRKGSRIFHAYVRDLRTRTVHQFSTGETKGDDAEQAVIDWCQERETREKQVVRGERDFCATFEEYLGEKTCRRVTIEGYWLDYCGAVPGKLPKPESNARGIYKPEFEGKLLTEITKGDIRAFVRKLTNAGASARTRRKHLSALRGFFDWCIDEHDPPYIERNPAKGMSAGQGEKRDGRKLTFDEAKALLAAARRSTIHKIKDNRRSGGEQSWPAPKHLFVALAIAFYTGLRRRSIHELTWRSVDLAGGAIDVPGISMKRGRPHRVPIHPVLGRVLGDVLRGRGKVDPDALVIGAEIGKTITALHGACKRAGLGPPIGWHTCRHSFGSWVARTAGFGAVKDLLGHKPKDTTFDYVSTPWPDLVAAVGKLPDLIGAGAASPVAPSSAQGISS